MPSINYVDIQGGGVFPKYLRYLRTKNSLRFKQDIGYIFTYEYKKQTKNHISGQYMTDDDDPSLVIMYIIASIINDERLCRLLIDLWFALNER